MRARSLPGSCQAKTGAYCRTFVLPEAQSLVVLHAPLPKHDHWCTLLPTGCSLKRRFIMRISLLFGCTILSNVLEPFVTCNGTFGDVFGSISSAGAALLILYATDSVKGMSGSTDGKSWSESDDTRGKSKTYSAQHERGFSSGTSRSDRAGGSRFSSPPSPRNCNALSSLSLGGFATPMNGVSPQTSPRNAGFTSPPSPQNAGLINGQVGGNHMSNEISTTSTASVVAVSVPSPRESDFTGRAIGETQPSGAHTASNGSATAGPDSRPSSRGPPSRTGSPLPDGPDSRPSSPGAPSRTVTPLPGGPLDAMEV